MQSSNSNAKFKFKHYVWLILLIFEGCKTVALVATKPAFDVKIQPIFNSDTLKLEEKLLLKDGYSLQIETLKFYLSNFEFYKNDQLIWKEPKSYHLIDYSDKSSLELSFEKPTKLKYNQIKFDIGIDSLTNVSGAMSGDLDPTKGMYWTWQSGYINFKLEGSSELCYTRNNAFQLHLGGYQSSFNALQTVVLEANKKGNNIITVNISAFIEAINLTVENHVMSPSEKAVSLSQLLSTFFNMQ